MLVDVLFLFVVSVKLGVYHGQKGKGLVEKQGESAFLKKGAARTAGCLEWRLLRRHMGDNGKAPNHRERVQSSRSDFCMQNENS